LSRSWRNDRNVVNRSICFKSGKSIVTDQGLIFEKLPYLRTIHRIVIVSIFAFTLLFFIVNKITPLRVTEDKEELGLDISQHGEFL
jgi:Amt family ammonium transporter